MPCVAWRGVAWRGGAGRGGAGRGGAGRGGAGRGGAGWGGVWGEVVQAQGGGLSKPNCSFTGKLKGHKPTYNCSCMKPETKS